MRTAVSEAGKMSVKEVEFVRENQILGIQLIFEPNDKLPRCEPCLQIRQYLGAVRCLSG